MNKRSITIQLKALLLCSVLLGACRKMVTVDPPPNQLTATEVFASDRSALSALAGLYSKMVSSTSFLNGATTIYTGLSADELTNTVPGTADAFSKNALTPTNTTIETSFWNNGYNYIYTCNALIEGATRSSTLSPEIKNQVIGEAKFMRAFCNFYLVNLFGDIPLVTVTDYAQNSTQARASSSKVYEQIIQDLTEAQSTLSAAYPSAGRVRPNKWTATTLLARVLLYQHRYSEAEAAATTVIQSGMYTLASDLNSVFLATSPEAIWQLMPNTPVSSSMINAYEGNLLIPASGLVPSYILTTDLLNSFEAGDGRKTAWVGKTVVNGTTYYFPYKYKIKTGPALSEYYMVLRLAEVYLIRAEARIAQNNSTGELEDINVLRTRSGLAPISSGTPSELTQALQKERRAELFCEWGQRWLDLKRWGIIDTVLGAEKAPYWQSTDALYPIPQSQRNVNGALTQNPGY